MEGKHLISTVTDSTTLDLSVIILTFNEEKHIARAIDSVSMIANEIIVVDSYSEDNTVEIAKRAGARVLQHTFINQAKQFQWALNNLGLTTAWIMRLDADEFIENDLVAELRRTLPEMASDVSGINLNRKHIFMGRWVRHGGRYPLRLLRVWRNGKGHVEDRWMDEHVVISDGSVVDMDGGFADDNKNNLTFFTAKHNKYATREAIEVILDRYNLSEAVNELDWKNASRQAALKRWIKEKTYNRLPFWAGPLGYFIYRYFFLLGFLDGRSGLIYHALQGFWYRFLVGAKVHEIECHLKNCTTDSERRTQLSVLTGINLTTED